MRLLLDTSVWRAIARGDSEITRAWLDRAQVAGHRILAAEEVTTELVVRALETKSDSAFLEVRRALILIERNADEALEPFPWRLARHLGLDPGPRLDTSSVREHVRGCRTHKEMMDLRFSTPWVGGSWDANLPRWPAALREEKFKRLDSLGRAIETAEPGLTKARQEMKSFPISRGDYQTKKSKLQSDRRALAKIEVFEMYRRLPKLSRLTGEAATRAEVDTLEFVGPYIDLQVEAVLDLYDGDHNRTDKKLSFDGNDWIDLAQTRHLQPGAAWVTLDRIWNPIARRSGQADRVLLPTAVVP